MPPIDRMVRWLAVDGFGAEHLRVRGDREGLTAESIVVGELGNVPYGLSYRLRCDGGWRCREAVFALVGEARTLHLLADGEGSWRSGDGVPLEALRGCVDIDIAATPFTNTLPIRRLRLARGQSRELRVAYIPVPSLRPEAAGQRYSCLEPDRLYRYESLPSGFTAELTVDEDGLVIDYPEMFRRWQPG